MLKICQSCGMEMAKEEDFGTNSDGSLNQEYCRFCFQKGNFTDPSITFEEMVNKVAHMMIAKITIPEEKALEVAKKELINLKRWK